MEREVSDSIKYRITQKLTRRQHIATKDFIVANPDGSFGVVKQGDVFELPMPDGPLEIEKIEKPDK